MSDYAILEDDHIDDQETINVGNLIIDLESDLEKEKIVNEQANHNVDPATISKCNISNSANTPSSTSQLGRASSSSSSNFNKSNNKSASNTNSDAPKHTNKANQRQHAIKKESTSINTQNSSLNNINNNNNNNGHGLAARTVFKSSADERGELKMKITRETKPGKNEHRIITSPNQRSPTSSSSAAIGSNNSMNLNIDHMANHDEGSSSIINKATQSSISSTRECGTSTSIGTITEPECLGPCEPGTSVTLEGIVWQETDGGILVVNVTWRGKTYVGALLDCTRHDWAPPRLCDSPASDIDAKTSKGVRPKRIVTRSNGIGLDEKNLLQTTGKLRNGKGRRIPSSNDPTCSKRQRETNDKPSNETSSAQAEANTPNNNMSSTNSEKNCVPMSIDASSANDTVNNTSNINTSTDPQESTQGTSNISIDRTGPNSPSLISCNEPNCNKKYRNMNGLLYHQSHAHSAENESSIEQEDITMKDAGKEQKSSFSDNRDCNSPPQQQSPQLIDQQQQQHSQRPMTSIPLGQPLAESSDLGPLRVPTPSKRDESSTVMHIESERRPPSEFKKIASASDVIFKSSSSMNQKQNDPLSHGSSSSRTQSVPAPKQSPQIVKQAANHPPMTSAEEGMKPSGTSTGPPPAPHQANCYFNPAFMANSYNPYALHSYFPRHMFDSMPPIPTSNAAMLSRLMNNMRNPPPPDSPSRLLSPSMPKNVPYSPFKLEPGGVLPPPQQLHPHQIPTSIALPGMPPMTNPSMPPIPVPPMQPMPPMPGGQSNLRMPSQGDSILPSTSQPPFLPPGSLNPALGIPGMGNPLAPLSMPNLIEEQMAKQFPRRLN